MKIIKRIVWEIKYQCFFFWLKYYRGGIKHHLWCRFLHRRCYPAGDPYDRWHCPKCIDCAESFLDKKKEPYYTEYYKRLERKGKL